MSASDESEPTTHACRNPECRASIANRYTFKFCVACALKAMHAELTADGYYDRQASRIARREEEEAADRLRARGVLR